MRLYDPELTETKGFYNKLNIGDRVQTINTLCPISGTIVDIYNNLIVISDDDAETDDDRLEFHKSDLEVT